MSWHYSQALVAEYLADNCSDGELSVLLNTNHMPRLFSSSDKMMEFCNHSQSGMTCEPLTGNHGTELLTWFLEDSLVKTFLVQDQEKGLTANEADFGEKCTGSFVKYDLNTCLWKTHQFLLFGGLELYSGNWPRWGTMQDGECWDTTPPADNKRGKEYGLLPTVTKELFSMWASAKQIIGNNGKRKSGASIGSIFGWRLAEWHLRNGGVKETDLIPNPRLCENLMGWVTDWTDLQELATGKYQQWLDLHGKH